MNAEHIENLAGDGISIGERRDYDAPEPISRQCATCGNLRDSDDLDHDGNCEECAR